jgi:hypothetical protein
MARSEPFDVHCAEYEAWSQDHYFAFLSGLSAMKVLFPRVGSSAEIGGKMRRCSRALQRGQEELQIRGRL